jgi:glycosyltransferase involved in cell wall biosynthesis
VKADYCSPDKISIIENGVDEDRFDPNAKFQDLRSRFGISPETFVLGFIGSMKRWHGVGNIIRVAEFCKNKLANHLFVIVGDGDLKTEYEAQVKALGLNDTVKFIARISHDDVPSYLSFMDVVLSLHYKQCDNAIEFHGSPLKIFEYMAMEKPIIAAPLGQIKELIVSGDNGLLLDGENAEGICKVLLQLEKDKSYRQKLGGRARQNVIESHTWKINAKKVEELCQDIILKE